MKLEWWRCKRALKHWWQRRTRGWDDSDTWSLDFVIAKFAVPRLKRFRELNNGFPGGMTEGSWRSALDDMIYALEICADEDRWYDKDNDWPRMERGLEAFGKHFRDLWW
ncbi:MAG: hypothetical protein ABFE07_28785 [Armatimonadia bacterium]